MASRVTPCICALIKHAVSTNLRRVYRNFIINNNTAYCDMPHSTKSSNTSSLLLLQCIRKYNYYHMLVALTHRKVELYSMAWQEAVDLSRFTVSAAPFGGPIGM